MRTLSLCGPRSWSAPSFQLLLLAFLLLSPLSNAEAGSPPVIQPPDPRNEPTGPVSPKQPGPVLMYGPVEGFTTSAYLAVDPMFVPTNTPIPFFVSGLPSGRSMHWDGLEPVGMRDGRPLFFFPKNGWYTISAMVEPGHQRLSRRVRARALNPHSLRFDYEIRPVFPFTVREGAANGDTMDTYFATESIAAVRTLADGTVTTSLGRTLDLSVALKAANDDPEVAAALGSLVEWRLDGRGLGAGHVVFGTSLTPGRHRVAIGPPDKEKSFDLVTYKTTIVSDYSDGLFPEHQTSTVNAVTDPPGYEADVVWMSSTKFGTATPTLGQGPTFTTRFEGTIGPLGEIGSFRWLGVRANEATLGGDQKILGPLLLSPSEGQVVGGPRSFVSGGFNYPTNVTPALEWSSDGLTFLPLAAELAPDRGPGTNSTTVDFDDFPSGPLLIRARSPLGADVHQVDVDRMPIVACTASRAGSVVTFHCGGSSDADGFIDHFNWRFGDGGTATGVGSSTQHGYVVPGRYDVEVTACDDLTLCTTRPYELVLAATGDPVFQAPPTCGCLLVDVVVTGNSTIRDSRRPNDNGTPNDPSDDSIDPAPLGIDPIFMSFNFEVQGLLKPGSDPSLCTEGQNAKGTILLQGSPPSDKTACSQGKDLGHCELDSDCDTHTCSGGLFDGEECDSNGGIGRCLLGGGTRQVAIVGVCTKYPLAGAVFGNDDYRFDWTDGGGPKLHCPACKSPTWLDSPGMPDVPLELFALDFTLNGEFLAFIDGIDGSHCACHFSLDYSWDHVTKTFNQGTGYLRVLDDALTVNCH
jgi:hypothetical protein